MVNTRSSNSQNEPILPPPPSQTHNLNTDPMAQQLSRIISKLHALDSKAVEVVAIKAYTQNTYQANTSNQGPNNKKLV